MTPLARLALLVATSALAASCSLGDNAITIDSPQLVTDVEAATARAGVVDGGGETIVAPDFELRLEPGEDPDQVLDLGLGDLEVDEEGNVIVPEPTVVDAPPDAILSLCPAAAAVITGVTGNGSDDELEVLLAGTPEALHSTLRSVVADPTNADLGGTDELDGFFVGACSTPLHAGALQLAARCAGTTDPTGCRASTVDDLGGLCFDDDRVLLSCISGLPATPG